TGHASGIYRARCRGVHHGHWFGVSLLGALFSCRDQLLPAHRRQHLSEPLLSRGAPCLAARFFSRSPRLLSRCVASPALVERQDTSCRSGGRRLAVLVSLSSGRGLHLRLLG